MSIEERSVGGGLARAAAASLVKATTLATTEGTRNPAYRPDIDAFLNQLVQGMLERCSTTSLDPEKRRELIRSIGTQWALMRETAAVEVVNRPVLIERDGQFNYDIRPFPEVVPADPMHPSDVMLAYMSDRKQFAQIFSYQSGLIHLQWVHLNPLEMCDRYLNNPCITIDHMQGYAFYCLGRGEHYIEYLFQVCRHPRYRADSDYRNNIFRLQRMIADWVMVNERKKLKLIPSLEASHKVKLVKRECFGDFNSGSVLYYLGEECPDALVRVFETILAEHQDEAALIIHLAGQYAPILARAFAEAVREGKSERIAFLKGLHPEIWGRALAADPSLATVAGGRAHFAVWAYALMHAHYNALAEPSIDNLRLKRALDEAVPREGVVLAVLLGLQSYNLYSPQSCSHLLTREDMNRFITVAKELYDADPHVAKFVNELLEDGDKCYQYFAGMLAIEPCSVSLDELKERLA